MRPDGSKQAVNSQRRFAENLSKPPIAEPALKFHLPEPVLRVRVAEAEVRVNLAARANVRHSGGVSLDRHRPVDAANRRRYLRSHSSGAPDRAAEADDEQQRKRSYQCSTYAK